MDISAIKTPGFSNNKQEILEDIAVLTGAEVISTAKGVSLKEVSLNSFGKASKVTITQEKTTIIAEGEKQAVKKRCEQIRRQMSTSDSQYERENLQYRLAKLAGGVGVIKVGASTETEMKEAKLRLEDALNSTRAAIEEGIVAGGGTTFVHLSKELRLWALDNLSEEEQLGALIISNALAEPLKRIVENCGDRGKVIVEEVKQQSNNIGYNALEEKMMDMYQARVIDPAKVLRSALQNSTSIATTILSTECLVVES